MKTKKVKSPKDMTAKEYVTTFDIPRTKFHLKNIFEFGLMKYYHIHKKVLIKVNEMIFEFTIFKKQKKIYNK